MKKAFLISSLCIIAAMAFTQGPPITLDKPIMLGARKGTVRVFGKHVETGAFAFNTLMLEGVVMRSGGGFYEVDVPDEEERLLCSLGGRLKKGKRARPP